MLSSIANPAAVLLLTAAILLPESSDGCPFKAYSAIKGVFDSKVDTLKQHSCFIFSSMRTLGNTEGIYDELGKDLSPESCGKLCKAKGHTGRIIGLTETECHCNKNFKKTGLVDLNKCTHKCPGKTSEFCGGVDHVSAYPNN